MDVGGESTAPGVQPVGPKEEQRRVLPVVEALVACGIRVSVDTYRASTARAAIAAGASIVNDVYGSDPGMVAAVAESGRDYVIMHNHGAPTTPASYGDVVADVTAWIEARVVQLGGAGVDLGRIIVDPGLGFSKQPEDNWELLRRLPELAALGHRVLIGASRKRFVKRLVGDELEVRDAASSTISALAAQAGASAVRVHDVAGTRTALAVAAAWGGVRVDA